MDEILSRIRARHKIQSMEKFERGETQANYKIQIEDGRFNVLRIFPSVARAEKEVRILERCQGTVVVPKILYKDLSEKPYIITSFLEGVHLGDLLEIADPVARNNIAVTLAKSLSQIHMVSVDLPAQKAPDYFEHIHHCLFERNGKSIIGAEKADFIWKKISDNREILNSFLHQRQLVHGDFKGANVLLSEVQGKWQVSAILDWEYALMASPLYDLSNFSKYIKKRIPDAAAAFLEIFLDTYSRAAPFPLPADWEQTCMYLDLIMHCDALVSASQESRRHRIGKEQIDKFIVCAR